ncbi:MAG: glycosyltransferase family 1 protein [Parvibaculum sp.]|uniref:glycosyltransferase family 4 protein n=1 Tax=Parvibaculum sp. TaxID=2024848 RepID=UPI003C795551
MRLTREAYRLAKPAHGQVGQHLRIVVVSDAAPPQVNGVVRTLGELKRHLTAMGHEVTSITPDQFSTLPMPSYPEIRLALFPGRRIARMIEAANPHAIHIATEGPLGLAARNYCVKRGLAFSTSFHTRFGEYLHARIGFPLRWSYTFLRWFHAPAATIMVATTSLQKELEERGFGRPSIWSRGVDTELFRPRPELQGEHYLGLERPVYLYVGRVAVEKNIDAFLQTELPGTKMIVGEGPRLEHLRRRHPQAHFTGALFGEDLAKAYAAADCFVFPSRTDTFGLVLIEALASGTPVAAYPVQGPLDVIGTEPVAALDEDLKAACLLSIRTPRGDARQFALRFSWQACAQQFLSNLALADDALLESR